MGEVADDKIRLLGGTDKFFSQGSFLVSCGGGLDAGLSFSPPYFPFSFL